MILPTITSTSLIRPNSYSPIVAVLTGFHFIQLFRERFFGKMCMHGTIPKGIVGYNQYTVPDTVAVELTFVAFL